MKETNKPPSTQEILIPKLTKIFYGSFSPIVAQSSMSTSPEIKSPTNTRALASFSSNQKKMQTTPSKSCT